ncbi:protein NRT1/ PTR FAMILY 5.4-like [Tasmannia lanceolata]|uniref:protein NRT1/ PTR FAMILY 5.4-like n=1 Tax=Tasmannia lanceolata TaxID=3420 RepID=UPI004063587B
MMEASQASYPLLNGLEDQTEVQKPSIGGWRSSVYIIVVEAAERFAFCGIAGNLVIYLTNVFHESTVDAVKNVNLWSGIASLLPLFGAFVADSYLGRYRTIVFSSLLYLLGLVTLSLSATMEVSFWLCKILFFISLYLVAVGEGGHKPCVLAFGADQFDTESVQQREAKNSFFNWWYFWICSGAGTGLLIVSYVQDNVGWVTGFAIPTIPMAFAFAIFIFGRESYRRQASSGSPFIGVAQVLVAAARKWRLPSTKDTEEGGLPGRTDQFKFLDKAAIKDELDELSKNEWRLCTVAQIEEVKQLLRLGPIWLSCLMYAVVLTHPGTFFTKQASTMNTKISSKFKVPPASLQVSMALVAIVTVPIYDRILIPAARRITGIPSGLTTLQRIGIGMFLSVISMVVAALVEKQRLKIARQIGPTDLTVRMSVWWLLPQYIIFGAADVFAIVGLQELFYDQMPDGLRSVGSAAYLSILSMGSFLSNIVIYLVEEISPEWLISDLNHSHLDYYYWLIAGLSTLWLVLYIIISKRFIYNQIHGDSL